MSDSDASQAIVPVHRSPPGTSELSPGRASTGGAPALVLAAAAPSSELQLVPHFAADAASAANALIRHRSVYVGDASGLAATHTVDGDGSATGDDGTGGGEFDRRAVTEVLTCGDGAEGQLMLGRKRRRANRFQAVHKLTASNVVGLSGSAFSSVATTETGELFLGGCNDEGQLAPERANASGGSGSSSGSRGGDDDDEYLLKPVRLDALAAQRIVQASAGENHVAAINQSQKVLTWGSNATFALGHTENEPFRVPPRVMRGLDRYRAVQVACGDTHTVVLTSLGEVFTAGTGAMGQLGHGERSDQQVAKRVDALVGTPVSQIAAGSQHTVAVSASGLAFAWGRNKRGQLGIGTLQTKSAAYSPQRVVALPELVQQAAAGEQHTIFITRLGNVYACGQGDHGQLGIGTPAPRITDGICSAAADGSSGSGTSHSSHPLHTVDRPVLIRSLQGRHARQAACGRRHSLVLMQSGQLWGFGSNEQGQLSLGDEIKEAFDPVRIEDGSDCGVFNVACGASHSVVVRVIRGSVLSTPPGSLPRGSMGFVGAQTLQVLAKLAREQEERVTSATAGPRGGGGRGGLKGLLAVLREVWSSPTCLAGSFRLQDVSENAFIEDRAPGSKSVVEALRRAHGEAPTRALMDLPISSSALDDALLVADAKPGLLALPAPPSGVSGVTSEEGNGAASGAGDGGPSSPGGGAGDVSGGGTTTSASGGVTSASSGPEGVDESLWRLLEDMRDQRARNAQEAAARMERERTEEASQGRVHSSHQNRGGSGAGSAGEADDDFDEAIFLEAIDGLAEELQEAVRQSGPFGALTSSERSSAGGGSSAGQVGEGGQSGGGHAGRGSDPNVAEMARDSMEREERELSGGETGASSGFGVTSAVGAPGLARFSSTGTVESIDEDQPQGGSGGKRAGIAASSGSGGGSGSGTRGGGVSLSIRASSGASHGGAGGVDLEDVEGASTPSLMAGGASGMREGRRTPRDGPVGLAAERVGTPDGVIQSSRAAPGEMPVGAAAAVLSGPSSASASASSASSAGQRAAGDGASAGAETGSSTGEPTVEPLRNSGVTRVKSLPLRNSGVTRVKSLPRPRSGILALPPLPPSPTGQQQAMQDDASSMGSSSAGLDGEVDASHGGADSQAIVPISSDPDVIVGGPYRFPVPQKPWPRPRTVYIQPSPAEELIGARRPFLAQPLVAARLSSSLLDVTGLKDAMKACFAAGKEQVIDTLSKAHIECLKALRPVASKIKQPDPLRAIMCIFQSPVLTLLKPSKASLETVSRLAEVVLALPQASRKLLLAWVAEDVSGAIFEKHYVKPMQRHLSVLIKATLMQRQSVQVAPGISALRGMEMLVVVLGHLFDLNADVARRAREVAVYGNAEAAEAARIGAVEGAAHDGGEGGAAAGGAAAASSSGPSSGAGSGDVGVDSRSAASSQGVSHGGAAAGVIAALPSTAGGTLGKVKRLPTRASKADAIRTASNELRNAAALATSQVPHSQERIFADEVHDSDSLGGKVWGLVPASSFNNPTVCELPEGVLQHDYRLWRQQRFQMRTKTFTLCAYPFLMDAATKRKVLSFEAALQMQMQMQSAMARSLFVRETPYLVVEVGRENLLRDSINMLASQHPSFLKKPLRVIFRGEEAIDAGGVTKEWFQLLLQLILDPSYGMFEQVTGSRLVWFRKNSMADPAEFRLIGIIVGLAIFNGVLLDVAFPRALYKKLLGMPVGLTDLIELDPDLGRGLLRVLEYGEDDMEDVFCLDFTAQYREFGETKNVELIPGGADIEVSQANKRKYVRAYVDWYLNQAVKQPGFKDFAHGFSMVADGPSLKLFEPEELALLVAGSSELDLRELEKVCEYDGGFTARSKTVVDFWAIVHGWPQKLQKNLLLFATGSARAPIGGLSKLNFKIQRNGGDTSRLPTASTCFNTLLLPEYGSKGKMEERLRTAVQNFKGFGLK